jgi:addiction module toxin, txe/yoeB family
MEPIYAVELTKKAIDQLKLIKKSGTKATKERLERIFYELAYSPMNINGFASPEKLKNFPNEEVWSRELSKKDRVLYEVFEDIKTIVVSQLLGHYKDK